MENTEFHYAQILAEILRIQRWAGGDSVPADRIFGLMNGFESTLRQERESFGISEQTQRKVEDVLEAIEAGKQSTNGIAIKDRLRSDGIDESDARCVIQLCVLQSRFGVATGKLSEEQGGPFWGLGIDRLPEQDWFGALHYMELVDGTEDAHKKLHAVFAPGIPRVGEFVTPEGGSKMEVVAVEHVMGRQGDSEGHRHRCLVPYIILKAIDDD